MLLNFLTKLEVFEKEWPTSKEEFFKFLDSIEMPSLEYCMYDFYEYIVKIIEYSNGNKTIVKEVLKRILDTDSDLYKVICTLLEMGYIKCQ